MRPTGRRRIGETAKRTDAHVGASGTLVLNVDSRGGLQAARRLRMGCWVVVPPRASGENSRPSIPKLYCPMCRTRTKSHLVLRKL